MSFSLRRFRAVPPLFLSVGALLLPSLRVQAGPPTFASPQFVETAKHVDVMVTGDFDDDGHQDVAVLDANGGKVEVRFGDGGGGYRSTTSSFTVTGASRGVAAGDIDGDGQTELLFAVSDAVAIYDWQAGGAFTSTHTIDLSATGIEPTNVAVGDLTDTGSRDIVVSDDFGSVGVVWISNDGAGNFGTPTAFAAGGLGFYAKLVTVDLDGDGLDEVILAREEGVGVLLNKGDGTLDTETVYKSSTLSNLRVQSVAAADVDHDGNTDLVATGYVHNNSTLIDTYSLCVSLSNGGNGTFADGKIFPFSANSGERIGALATEAADLNGDGRPEIINVVDVPGTMSTNPYSGFVTTRWTGTGATLAVEGQDTFNTGDGVSYSALALADPNEDTQPDVLVGTSATIFGTTMHSQFAMFTNGTPSIPGGRKVQFTQTSSNAAEGSEVDVTVTRGTESTGQLLAFFTVGGTATQGRVGDKKADFSITDPAEAQPVVFADGEYSKSIHLAVTSTKGAESAQTIILTLLDPVGDAEPVDQADPKHQTTITITDSQPASVSKPGALTVKPANIVKSIPTNIPKIVKVAGRTGSDWTFSTSQKLPADAVNATIKVQTSIEPPANNHWTDYLTLRKGKGTSWSAVDRHPPLCSVLFFRTVTHADGYPDIFGAPTQPFASLAGPELALNVTAASDSDTAGATTHTGEYITYHFTVANVSHEAAATPAVLTVPIPKHTTFVNGTSGFGPFTQVKDKSGATTAVTWTFTSLPTSGTYTEDLIVQVDVPGMFSAKEQKKTPNGIGYVVSLTGYSLAAPTQGIKAAAILHTDFASKTSDYRTQILGPLKLSVSSSPSTVGAGGLITYTFACQNDSGQPLTGAVVYDSIPALTTLANVYTFDIDGNANTTPLPNPGAFTNPAIVYGKTDTTAKFDLSIFPVIELPLLKPLAKLKAGRVAVLNNLSATTIKLLIDDGFIAPIGVRWVMGTIPGAGTPGQSNVRFVSMTVRVPYDQAATDANGNPVSIVNNDYDFLIPGTNPISALYGAKAAPISVAVNQTAPTDKPHLILAKSARGDITLNNPALHGNGFANITGIGNVVSVVEHRGVDYQLAYRNDLDNDGHGADAHGVVLHDVIPEGMTLRGFFKQDINDTGFAGMTAGQFTFYDKNGAIIPGVDPSTNQDNMALVRSLDIRLGEVSNLTFVPKNTHGTVRYTCEPNITPTTTIKYTRVGTDSFYGQPGVVHSYAGFTPAKGPSDKAQGFYLSTTDQLQAIPGGPDDCIVRVVTDVSWDFPAPSISVNDSQPFDVVPFDFHFTQNGDVPASNAVIKFSVPTGVTFLNSASFIAPTNAVVTLDRNTHNVANGSTGYDVRPQRMDDHTPLTATQTGSDVQIALGTVAGHSSQTVRVFFQLNGPTLNPAIKAAGFRYGPANAHIVGSYSSGGAGALREGRTRGASSITKIADAAATGTNKMTARDLSQPKLGISRSAPFSVRKGEQFAYTLSFTNLGDTDATNVTAGMQIPFRVDFVSATNGVLLKYVAGTGMVPQANPRAYTTTPRSGIQLKPAGGSLHPGPDVVTWHFDSLPAHSKASVELVVRCDSRFGDEPVQDHSAYLQAENAGTTHVAAYDITTWIYATSLNDSKIRAAQAFFANQGVTLTPELVPLIGKFANTLGKNSKVNAFGGLDALHLVGKGVKIIPLGKDQVFVISNDGASIVAQGGGNIITNDGGSIVATGGGNAISVKDISSSDSNLSGTRSCSYLLDNIPAIVASGAGNIVAAGAGNLITNDGGSLVSNHPGGGFTAISQLAGTAVQADGNAIISNDGGSALAPGAPIIGNDGASLIGSDSAGLITNDGGSIIGNDGASLTVFARGGAGIISTNGGGIISTNGGGIIGNDGASALPFNPAQAAPARP